MKITDTDKTLCDVINTIKNNLFLGDEWEINGYFEYDYQHNMEIEISSKEIDSKIVFSFNKDYNLISYELKGREKSVYTYNQYVCLIDFIEKNYRGTRQQLLDDIESMKKKEALNLEK